MIALLLPQDGHAQTYPDRTINYIVPSSPGSSPDIVGRIMAEALGNILGTAGRGAQSCRRGRDDRRRGRRKAAPDGYTILQANTNHSFSQTLLQKPQLRSGEGLQPGRALCVRLLHRPGAPQGRCQNAERADRQGQSGARKAELRVGRHRRRDLHRHRGAQGTGRIDMVHVPYDGGGPALASILAGSTDIYGSPYATAEALRRRRKAHRPRRDVGRSGSLTFRTSRRSPKRFRATR